MKTTSVSVCFPFTHRAFIALTERVSDKVLYSVVHFGQLNGIGDTWKAKHETIIKILKFKQKTYSYFLDVYRET